MASSTDIGCTDCKKSGSFSNQLDCGKHHVCQNCLIARALKQPSAVTDCLVCKFKSYDSSYSFSDAAAHKPEPKGAPTSPTQPADHQFFDGNMPGIWIFVDNSNIWIEAKKLQSRVRKFKTSEDHRVRIDAGKLADVIAGGRCVEQGFLYGSEPPPVDTVWKKIKEKGWKVKTKRRSIITGKEKQVDAQLVADVTEIAIETPRHERTTIVLVTGDADVIPALDKVIERDRWKIEVYMWQQAISGKFRKYASKHENRVAIKHLDHCLDQATFTCMWFPISSNPNLKSKVKENGIVFSMTPKAFGNRIPSKNWCNLLESITQWPFQYYWFQVDNKDTDNLVVVFSNDRDGAKFDVAKFLATIHATQTADEGKYQLPKVKSAQQFIKFIEDKFKDEPDQVLRELDMALEQVGIYDHEDVSAGFENDNNYVSDSEDKWSVVQPKKKSRPSQLYSEDCPYKFNCFHGTHCRFKHTEEEKLHFRTRKDGRGNPLRKVQECRHFQDSRCYKMKQECDYAHGDKDAWCLQCRSTGHFTSNCTSNKDRL